MLKPLNIINAKQFDLNFLEELFILSDKIRKLSKTKEGANYLSTLLNNKRAMLFFTQPSTRTFLSFQSACHILGIKTSDIRDPNTSSEKKVKARKMLCVPFQAMLILLLCAHLLLIYVAALLSTLVKSTGLFL